MWGRGLACVSALHGGVWRRVLLPADPGSVRSEHGELGFLPLVAQLLDQPGRRGETLLLIPSPPSDSVPLLTLMSSFSS